MSDWRKVDPQNPLLPDQPSDFHGGAKERPVSVTLIAAYQWIKALLFLQLFWYSWITPPLTHGDLAIGAAIEVGKNYTALLLAAVAAYFVVLGFGLWRLQKWALLLLLLVWLPDLVYGFWPEQFGLQHLADSWLGERTSSLLIGITIADTAALFTFANRDTFRAFDAEDEAKILWWLLWWT